MVRIHTRLPSLRSLEGKEPEMAIELLDIGFVLVKKTSYTTHNRFYSDSAKSNVHEFS